MRIDKSHRHWAFAALGILTVASIAYVPYLLFYPGGPRGNSIQGLIYGVLGYGMMLFAGLMGARKRVPIWRLGRASVWMRGHMWLGALSLPMILFHSGFSMRGPLTFVLMTLLWLTFFSGIAGAAIQHFVPAGMTSSVKLETIYEQIPQVREKLHSEAHDIVDRLCAAPDVPSSANAVAIEEEVAVELTVNERENVRSVYLHQILPFLRDPDHGEWALGDPLKAKSFFDALRMQSPPSIHGALCDLENICEEERHLTRQRKIYYWLHGWLLIHVPLSITLLVLGGIHALVAIRY